MKLRDYIYGMKMAVRKFENDPYFKEQVTVMKANIRDSETLSQDRLSKTLSKTMEKDILKYFKKLGIEITEIKPIIDNKTSLIKEMNKIANEMM